MGAGSKRGGGAGVLCEHTPGPTGGNHFMPPSVSRLNVSSKCLVSVSRLSLSSQSLVSVSRLSLSSLTLGSHVGHSGLLFKPEKTTPRAPVDCLFSIEKKTRMAHVHGRSLGSHSRLSRGPLVRLFKPEKISPRRPAGDAVVKSVQA